MKIRIGFVSNSSSTSFVLMTSLENHEKAMAKLNDYGRAVIMAMRGDTQQFGGEDMVLIGSMDSNDSPARTIRPIAVEPNTIQKRSCRHKMIEGAEFCHKCGARRYYDVTLQFASESWKKYEEEIKKGDHLYLEMRD